MSTKDYGFCGILSTIESVLFLRNRMMGMIRFMGFPRNSAGRNCSFTQFVNVLFWIRIQLNPSNTNGKTVKISYKFAKITIASCVEAILRSFLGNSEAISMEFTADPDPGPDLNADSNTDSKPVPGPGYDADANPDRDHDG